MRALPLAAAAALLLPAPAVAAPAPNEPPMLVAGASCGLVVASQGPQSHVGVVNAGPVTAQSTDGAEASAGITCSVRVGDDSSSYEVYRTSAPSGTLPPQAVVLHAKATAQLLVCTEITVRRPPGPTTVVPYDADPAKPGPQCRKAQASGDAVLVANVAPSDPMAWWCLRVRAPEIPEYGYQDVCNPLV